MGITGELVRSVFSKSRSIKTHDSHLKYSTVEKKKWRASVKLYLCGDEFFDSVVAEEDSASIKSSEATVMQILPEDGYVTEDIQSRCTSQYENQDSYQNSLSSKFIDEDVAATIIQSAFRGFKVRSKDSAGFQNYFGKGMESPSKESLATSIEVQTGNSTGIVSVQEEDPSVSTKHQHNWDSLATSIEVQTGNSTGIVSVQEEEPSVSTKHQHNRDSFATSIEVQTGNSTGVISVQEEDPSVSTKHQQKLKPPSFKPKEDWDDSTLDSTASKMRIQNRLEAMTRRERAMAYAFSQQLRICSKKKQAKSDGSEPDMGWSWLERWMATRQIEIPPMEDCTSKQLNNNEAGATVKIRPILRKKFLDLSFEEKESCGSNEVPVLVTGSPNSERKDKDGTDFGKNRLKIPRRVSRRKSAPSYQKGHSKVGKKDGTREAEKDKRQKAKQARHNNVCKDVASWLPPDYPGSGQNSRSDP